MVVHKARTHGRTHEAVRLAPQPQPHATLARRVPALECGVQLGHEAAHLIGLQAGYKAFRLDTWGLHIGLQLGYEVAHLVLAALPHAYLDAAVPVLAH